MPPAPTKPSMRDREEVDATRAAITKLEKQEADAPIARAAAVTLDQPQQPLQQPQAAL